MITVAFKSIPENWKKEFLGLKKNTIRVTNQDNDVRFEHLRDFEDGNIKRLVIEIINTETKESFRRLVSDVTTTTELIKCNHKHCYLISWF